MVRYWWGKENMTGGGSGLREAGWSGAWQQGGLARGWGRKGMVMNGMGVRQGDGRGCGRGREGGTHGIGEGKKNE